MKLNILGRLICATVIVIAIATLERGASAAHLFPAEIATIPVGFATPLGLAIDHAANRIYVAGSDFGVGGAVSVIDGSTNAVITSIPVAAGALYAALNPLTQRLYVTHGFGANTVSVIDTVTNTVVTTIAVGRVPFGVAVNSVTNRVYVANNYGGFVSVIDGATNAVVRTVVTPLSPLSVTADPLTNRFYVTYGTSVAVIDGATDTIVATISDFSSTLAFGIGLDPVTQRLYVPRFDGPLGGTVAVMDIVANAVVASIPVGGNPNGIGVNPATRRVYVGARAINQVAVIDSATDSVIDTIAVGSSPFDVAANAVTDRVYVTNARSGTVSVIEDVFADLSVSLSDSPDPVLAAHVFTYTIVITNHGVSTATGVTLSHMLPSVIAGFPVATSSQGICSVTQRAVTCDLGTVASGASATVAVSLRATRPGTITSTASVQANEPDPILANNSDQETTTVRVPSS